MPHLIAIETTAHHATGKCPVKFAVHPSGGIIVHFPLTDHADFPKSVRPEGKHLIAFECFSSAHASARLRTYAVPWAAWEKALALPVPDAEEQETPVELLALALPSDLVTRLEIAARVAEDLFGGEWEVERYPARRLPAVARLHREEDGEEHTIAFLEGRLCIAVRLRSGLVPDENLSAVFDDVAVELFPERIPAEEPTIEVPVLDLLPALGIVSPEVERCMVMVGAA